MTHLRTMLTLIQRLASSGRWFLVPLVVVLLVVAGLLVVTQSVPLLAPFVYAVF